MSNSEIKSNCLKSIEESYMLYGTKGDDYIEGGKGDDYIEGGEGDDHIEGGKGGDLIVGEKGNDKLFGGEGDDYIEGGEGGDIIEGGEGNDFFIYQSINDSLSSSPDKIIDFTTGHDKIDFSGFGKYNGNSTKIKQVNHFSDQKNAMMVDYDKSNNLTKIMVDGDGNGEAEFQIVVVGGINPTEDIMI